MLLFDPDFSDLLQVTCLEATANNDTCKEGVRPACIERMVSSTTWVSYACHCHHWNLPAMTAREFEPR